MTEKDNADLIIRLAHELGVALELGWDPTEWGDLFEDGLDALADAKAHLSRIGLVVPEVIDKVLSTWSELDRRTTNGVV